MNDVRMCAKWVQKVVCVLRLMTRVEFQRRVINRHHNFGIIKSSFRTENCDFTPASVESSRIYYTH